MEGGGLSHISIDFILDYSLLIEMYVSSTTLHQVVVEQLQIPLFTHILPFLMLISLWEGFHFNFPKTWGHSVQFDDQKWPKMAKI